MELTFLLDENLQGDAFSSVLRNAGISVVLTRDEGFDQLEDAVWIPEATRRGYIIVSGDRRQYYRPWEKEAIVRSSARVFHVVPGKSVTHPQLARNFVNTLPLIVRYAMGTPAPFLATIARPPRLVDLEAGLPGTVSPRKLPILG